MRMAQNISSVHPSTGYTPFHLMFGCQACMPIDIMFGTTPSHTQSQSEYATQLRQDLESAYHQVWEHLRHKLADRRNCITRRSTASHLSVGTWFDSTRLSPLWSIEGTQLPLGGTLLHHQMNFACNQSYTECTLIQSLPCGSL